MKDSSVENILFDPNYTDLNFHSYYIQFPDYYKGLENYKNIPFTKFSFISQYNYDISNFFHEIYLNDFISTVEHDSLNIQWGFDTKGVYDYNFSDQFTVFTGIRDNRQFVIADANNDKDFNNELIQSFNLDFRKNSLSNDKVLLNLPRIKYNYTLKNKKNHLDIYNRDIILFPSIDNVYASIAEDELNKELHLIGRIKDYWEGQFNYKDNSYDIVAQGISKEFLQILIKADSLNFNSENYLYNKEFEYRLHDTIKLSDDLFVIAEVQGNIENILLERINIKEFRGFRRGEIIKDFELINLDDSKVRLSSIKRKKFILLDFWGTWCSPCLKHVPFIKYLSKKYSNELVVIGIAHDEVDKVRRYSIDNNMIWQQTYIKDKYSPNSINSKLRIEGFPTYILLDENLNIVSRVTGPTGLNEIEKIIMQEIKKD